MNFSVLVSLVLLLLRRAGASSKNPVPNELVEISKEVNREVEPATEESALNQGNLTEVVAKIVRDDIAPILEQLKKINTQLPAYFSIIETYFISILTEGNRRITAHDEQLGKILLILTEQFGNSSLALQSAPKQEDRVEVITATKIEQVALKGADESAVKPPPVEVNYNYYFSDNKFNWYASEDVCGKMNWTLVSIKSEAQLQLIWNLMPRTDACYWTAGSDIGNVPGNFNWPGDEKVSDALWGQDEPNDFNDDLPTCIILCGQKLYDVNCLNNTRHFICQNPD